MKAICTTPSIAVRNTVRAHSHRGRLIAPLLAALCALAVCPVQAQTAAANIVVNANMSSGVVPITAGGVNAAAWDGKLLDVGIPSLLKNAGVNILRYPGGSTADYYHWATQKITANLNNTGSVQIGTVDPNSTFDAFMTVAQKSNATAIITVNYGSNADGTAGGDPTEAANWVKYANITKGYNIKYWEVGNEVYGNGQYSAPWELDLHTDHTPTAYANNVLQYIAQMKAQDPTIKVGAVLTAPGHGPDGQNSDWNRTVLSICGSKVDFVVVHWYPQEPGQENDSNLLNSAGQIAGMTSQLQTFINQYCGPNAANVQILVTETNSVSYHPGKQTLSVVNSLFLADNVITWLEHGVTSVDWWDLHNSPYKGNADSGLLGSATYGSYGLLSSGEAVDGGNVPALDSPYPSYYGLQMVHNLMQPGDSMVSAASDQSLITAHATRQANGHLKLMLINKNRDAAINAVVSLNGFTPSGSAQTFYYGKDSAAITNGTATVSRNFTTALPPYSLTVLDMTPAPVSSSPAFTTTASVTPSTLAPGQTATIHVTPTDTGGALTNGVVDLEVFDASGSRVGQQFYTQQNFASGQSQDYTWPFAVPSDMGAYTVKVGVFSQNWSSLLYWNDSAAAFTVFLSDPAQYTFENGTQGWTTTGGAIAGVSSSTTRAYLGAHSLAVAFNGSYSDTQQVYVPLPPLAAGKTVTFHVWIPKDSAVYAIQPYTLQGASGNWQWSGSFQYTSGMTPNAWNTVTLTVPANAATPLAQLGVQFFTGGAWSGTCYIDSVTW